MIASPPCYDGSLVAWLPTMVPWWHGYLRWVPGGMVTMVTYDGSLMAWPTITRISNRDQNEGTLTGSLVMAACPTLGCTFKFWEEEKFF